MTRPRPIKGAIERIEPESPPSPLTLPQAVGKAANLKSPPPKRSFHRRSNAVSHIKTPFFCAKELSDDDDSKSEGPEDIFQFDYSDDDSRSSYKSTSKAKAEKRSVTMPSIFDSSPGGLSINTTAANAPGTNTSQPANLFGQLNTSNTAAAPGSIFNNAASQQSTPQPGGMFGMSASSSAAAAPAITGTSLLNTTTPASTSTAAAPNFFGSAQTAAKPGGLFSTPATTSGQPSTNMFGGANTAQTTTLPTSSLFNTRPAATTQAQSSGGLFGGAGAAQTNTQPTSSLFNAYSAPQQPSQPQGQATGSIFGQGQVQQPAIGQNQPVVPAARISYDSMTSRTRYEELSEPVKTDIDQIDNAIQSIIEMYGRIMAFLPGHADVMEKLQVEIEKAEEKLKRVQAALSYDVNVVNRLREKTRQRAATIRMIGGAIDNLRLPTQYHTTNLSAVPHEPNSENYSEVTDCITYFVKICDELDAQHGKLTSYLNEIKDHLPTVENGVYDKLRLLRDNPVLGPHIRGQLEGIMDCIILTNAQILERATQCVRTRDKLLDLGLQQLPPPGLGHQTKQG